MTPVDTYRVSEAAELIGVSDDTVRRWVEAGRLPSRRVDGRTVIDGTDLAAHLAEAASAHAPRSDRVSARNRMPGIVTRVVADTVMAQVEIACGPFRVVSLMSAEAATELGLEPGARAVASVKSTNVVVERP